MIRAGSEKISPREMPWAAGPLRAGESLNRKDGGWMNEISRIAADIRAGALGREDLFPFLAWLFRKVFWVCFAVIVIGAAVLLAGR